MCQDLSNQGMGLPCCASSYLRFAQHQACDDTVMLLNFSPVLQPSWGRSLCSESSKHFICICNYNHLNSATTHLLLKITKQVWKDNFLPALPRQQTDFNEEPPWLIRPLAQVTCQLQPPRCPSPNTHLGTKRFWRCLRML